MQEAAHLALHPCGQIPAYEAGAPGLFETGAIVFHIAERHAGLLPIEAHARARAIPRMFAAEHGGAADPRTPNRQDHGA